MDPDGHSIKATFVDFFLRRPGGALQNAADALCPRPVTEEELLEAVDDADAEQVDDSQKEMIAHIIELDDVTAGDIMTHRIDMVAVEESTPCREVLRTALESGNSRLPIYRKTVDEIVGILYVKDLLHLFEKPEAAERPVTDFLRPAMFVPESRRAQELLLDFKRQHTMMAVVVDEYGGTAGLVSMEDVLEEIVGEIQDEYDDEEDPLMPCPDGFVADAALDLEDLFDALGLEMPELGEDEDFDTVGSLVADRLGHVPSKGENAVADWGGVRFQVVQASERRILKVRCTRIPNPDEQADTEDTP